MGGRAGVKSSFGPAKENDVALVYMVQCSGGRMLQCVENRMKVNKRSHLPLQQLDLCLGYCMFNLELYTQKKQRKK